MNWQTLEGSNALQAFSYDPASYVFGVQTKDGKPYFYLDVPPEVHQRFLAADSKGKFWLQVIKPKYQCQKGDGTLALKSPVVKQVEPKVQSIIAKAAETAPPVDTSVGETMALSITSFVQGGLKERMDEFCAPIATRVDLFVSTALQIVDVADEKGYALAAECGKQIATERKSITELLKPTKRSIDSVKQIVLDKEHELVGKLEAAEDRLSKLCTGYRVAEQRRAAEAAEAERKRKLKEAEDARIAQAEMAQAAGKEKLADALLSTPVTAPNVEVKSNVPTGTGARGKVNYKFRVLDLAAVPREWLILNESLVGKYARDNKLPDGSVLHGIEFYQDPDTNF